MIVADDGVPAAASQHDRLMPAATPASPVRPPRIATVCVRGHKPKRPEHNGRGMRLLDTVIDAVAARADWRPIDAVVLPGGFFRAPEYLGHRSQEERAHRLGATDFGRACAAAASRLAAVTPGALVVVGIDSGPRGRHDNSDQMCVALDAGGVAGIGRKVFPADGDTNGDGRPPVVCYAGDYTTPEFAIEV